MLDEKARRAYNIFIENTEGKAMLEVVAALIRRGERYLICRRPMHKARGGQWEFPGGKVEKGETKQQAIVREIREELAVQLCAGEAAAEVIYAYPDLTVHLSLLDAQIISGEPATLEHSELAWVTLGEMQQYDLCPADRMLLQKIGKA